jgi:hypothetical protein
MLAVVVTKAMKAPSPNAGVPPSSGHRPCSAAKKAAASGERAVVLPHPGDAGQEPVVLDEGVDQPHHGEQTEDEDGRRDGGNERDEDRPRLGSKPHRHQRAPEDAEVEGGA